jgi:hypothetical protein
MRGRILTALAVVLLLSVWVATAAAAKKQPYPTTQQLCETTYGGTFSTKANSSFFRPFYKKQGVVWTCNSYTGDTAAASLALSAACLSDGGQQAQTISSGFATCWKNSA